VGLSGCIDYAFKAADFAKEHAPRTGEFSLWIVDANKGDPEAQYYVGNALCCGKRPLYNNHEALKWLCRSSRQGQRDAMLRIGGIYEKAHTIEGSVLPRDDTLAYVYYTKALEYGNDKAKVHKERVFNFLNEQERAVAAGHLVAWPDVPCESDKLIEEQVLDAKEDFVSELEKLEDKRERLEEQRRLEKERLLREEERLRREFEQSENQRKKDAHTR
jgi:hypothetical protein